MSQEYHKAFVDAKYTSSNKQDYLFEFVVAQSSLSSQYHQKNIAEIYWIWEKKRVGETPVRDLQLWEEFDEEGCNVDEAHEEPSSDGVPYPEEGFGTPGGLPLLKVSKSAMRFCSFLWKVISVKISVVIVIVTCHQ